MSAVSTCFVYRGNRTPQPLTDLSKISDVLAEPDSFVWFDVVAPQRDDLQVIQREFDLHPLAIEDAVKAHQRSKIESYENYWFLVVHGLLAQNSHISVHEIAIFVGQRFVLTVRAQPAYPLDEIQRRWEHQPDALPCDSGTLLYAILDTLVDGYWPAAEQLEETAAELEALLFESGGQTREALIDIFSMKKDVQRFRKVVVPMREIVTAIMRNDLNILHASEVPYYRDVYDHATRVIEEMDAARDVITSALEIQLGITSNQQNEVSKQLTVIATIFLPLSYLTGFFGQNFAVLVNNITSQRSFFIFGLGLEAAALVVLLLYFKRKRWV